ncbi:MAG: aminoglycoside 3'-phosphotransferase [Clostridia bacterium]|nr:aminoglycoside 3'-phosphotransferase [Clostridia bacterium]
MKRTRLDSLQRSAFPAVYQPLLSGAEVFDSSCSPEARVWFVDRGEGFYLKRSAAGTLAREAELTRYFHEKGLATQVWDYRTENGFDWLLTARMAGEDCTHPAYLAEPERLCDLLAECLRELHDTDGSDCPVQARMQSYLALARANYERGAYDLSYYRDYDAHATVEDVWRVVEQAATAFQNDTLLHGDYCLPNIVLNNWHFSGFIDLGNGGVGDRHVDLYWGAWTLRYNLKTDRYRERFFDAYGRERINTELLRAVAACEVFG